MSEDTLYKSDHNETKLKQTSMDISPSNYFRLVSECSNAQL